jgi:hypothetical protein
MSTENQTRNLIHLYIDGDQWCAIYPLGSDIMNCQAIAFSPVRWVKNYDGIEKEYGRWAALQKLKDENPSLPTHSFYCES